MIDNKVSNWNNIKKVGWYSGSSDALNSPEINIGWFQVLVLAENGNIKYLHCIGFTLDTKKIYGRVSDGRGGFPDWTDSKWFLYN